MGAGHSNLWPVFYIITVMTIGEISNKTGLSIYTIRYYEKEGIIFPIKRIKGNLRDFSETDLRWIEFVMCLKATGMSLEKIKQYAESTSKGEEGYEELVLLLKEHKKDIREKIKELKSFEEKIDWKIDLYTK